MRRSPNVIYLPQVLSKVYAKKWSFAGLFIAVYFLSFTFLSALGIGPGSFAYAGPKLPLPSEGTAPSVAVEQGKGEFPVRIVIPAVGIEANVANPNTTDIDALDRELLAGAVRYPGTGLLGENGTVLMFGHSSHLPVVHNQAYKAFNDIQKLSAGDPIYVYSEGKTYTYVVEKVESMNTSTGAIPIDASGAKLVLATCDNFGAKSDRFVVTASLAAID